MLFKFLPGVLYHLGRPLRWVTSKQVGLLLTILMVSSFAMVGCAGQGPVPQEKAEMPLSLSSTAFKEGDKIPVKYTCDGENISPPLAWDEPPQKTQAFVLIVDDPDAPVGVFTHWVVFNIPGNVRRLGEGVPARERIQSGGLQGKNDFGRIGYGGPCPPHGTAHRYRFTVYALDRTLDLKPGVSKKQILDAMRGHILAQGQLMGTYQR